MRIGNGNGDKEGLIGQTLRLLHIDPFLLFGVMVLCALGLLILYGAGGEHSATVVRQLLRMGMALVVMLALAQVPANHLRLWSPWIYVVALILLSLVLLMGEIGKGAQRWLDLGIVRFQPSELMKLAVPMMLAWYFADRRLPPTLKELPLPFGLVGLPVLMIAGQPDLGTALLVAAAGLLVIFLAGIGWRVIAAFAGLGLAAAPLLWWSMKDYQRQRVLTFFDPGSDPLGAGYHIIQSQIAIGSGGLYGKGWLHGTQSQLNFLPERATDFIFAVFGEEFGFMGALALLILYVLLILRALVIAANAQDTYSRLLAGSLSLTFFIYLFVNTGMVTGLLPVVGVPLPLVSYGGTSMVTLMAAFGILMSIHSHRRLLAK